MDVLTEKKSWFTFIRNPLAIQRQHTMPRFINHDGLADGWLNLGHCSGTGVLLPWKLQLTSTEDILDLTLTRLEKDWVTLAVKMRKPWSSASLESWWFFNLDPFVIYLGDIPWVPTSILAVLHGKVTKTFQAQLHRVCAGFVACMDQFHSQVPKKYADAALIEINKS